MDRHSGHEQIKKGEWDVCAATADAYDVKNKASYSTSTCEPDSNNMHAACLPTVSLPCCTLRSAAFDFGLLLTLEQGL